jgi:hypothetical protein
MPRNYDIAELRRLDIAHHLPARPMAWWRPIAHGPTARLCSRCNGTPNGAQKMTRIRKPISTFWERR